MNEEKERYFIIDTYSPYEKNDDVRYIFEYNDRQWCIREVTKFEWGQPQYDERPLEDEFLSFQLYYTFEDALRFARELKGVYV